MPFGPYRGMAVSEVALIDPDYLLGLLREGLGTESFRAAAAQALARRAWPVNRRPSQRPGTGMLAWLLHSGYAAWLLGGLIGILLLAAWRWDPLERPPSQLSAGQALPVPSPDSASSTQPAPRGRGSQRAVTAIDRPKPRATALGPRLSASPEPTPAPAIDPMRPCGQRVPGAISAEMAKSHLGQHASVEFRVLGSKDTGRVTFLNSRLPYQGHFYVAIFPDQYAGFPIPPAEMLQGQCIIVQGLVEAYRGAPQIVLRSAEDLRVLEEPPPDARPAADAIHQPAAGPDAAAQPSSTSSAPSKPR